MLNTVHLLTLISSFIVVFHYEVLLLRCFMDLTCWKAISNISIVLGMSYLCWWKVINHRTTHAFPLSMLIVEGIALLIAHSGSVKALFVIGRQWTHRLTHTDILQVALHKLQQLGISEKVFVHDSIPIDFLFGSTTEGWLLIEFNQRGTTLFFVEVHNSLQLLFVEGGLIVHQSVIFLQVTIGVGSS